MKQILFIATIISVLSLCACSKAQVEADTKMDGVSFVSPSKTFPAEYLLDVQQVKANWVAISPFAFSRDGSSAVTFNSNFQWWGERAEGIRTIIDYAQSAQLKVLLKPQVWMRGSWVGTYDLETEEAWEAWEKDYEAYILTFAKIAAEKNVEAFCVGTEYKIAALKRESFWRDLITKVRDIYNGELTYASNWDHYQNIPFWEELDFIGVDAYFPLQEKATPDVETLVENWKPVKEALRNFSDQKQKPIVFTEYGYMSCDFTAWKNWENEADRSAVGLNLDAQSIAFEALYQSLWNEPWFGGGFIWKWYHNYEQSGGENDKDYTPQRKPAEQVIQKWYAP